MDKETKALICDLLFYARPEIRRGPAIEDWVRVMKEGQRAVGYIECPKCRGKGEAEVLVRRQSWGEVKEFLREDLCTACLGTGLVDPEDWKST